MSTPLSLEEEADLNEREENKRREFSNELQVDQGNPLDEYDPNSPEREDGAEVDSDGFGGYDDDIEFGDLAFKEPGATLPGIRQNAGQYKGPQFLEGEGDSGGEYDEGMGGSGGRYGQYGYQNEDDGDYEDDDGDYDRSESESDKYEDHDAPSDSEDPYEDSD